MVSPECLQFRSYHYWLLSPFHTSAPSFPSFLPRLFISADFLLCARIPFTVLAVRFDLIIPGSALLDIRKPGFAVVKTGRNVRNEWKLMGEMGATNGKAN